ncbi:D-ribitol-5-phosphate cytidylyltransferase, partial [Testudinibacter sp. TR-2022]|uniref:IspD/TarI family cytidylyltransferase n=1 Tax=Testudinibacter sp. TR-2022 TaxID=2585029 RepID=UPI00111A1AC7
MNKNIAIILSGGSGSRFGGPLPKQFTKLAGKAVIEYTIETFESSNKIDEIFIVSKNEYIEKTWDIINRNNWKKVSKVLVGGKERFDSTYSALIALRKYSPETKVIFHDAVRPLITQKIIHDCIDKLDLFDAVDVVIPSSDTLVEVYDDGCISNIPNRNTMRRGQTPQAFKLKTISTAYQMAVEQKRNVFTCDCGVVRSMLPQTRVATIEGSEKNIKITQSLDLFIAEKQLQISERTDIDDRIDLCQLKGKTLVIFGGSSGIGKSMAEIAKLHNASVYIASRKYNNVDITNKESIINF